MDEALFARFGREYQAGDVLFRQGEAGEVMFVIQSGAVRITRSLAGEERVVAVVGAGEFLGELAILNGRPRSATATVLEPTRCLVVHAKMLEQMVTRNAEIAVRLIRKLAQRLDAADALLDVLLHRDPQARLMLALTRWAERSAAAEARTGASPAPDGVRIRASLADIAKSVGASDEAAEEVMGRLRRLRLAWDEPGAVVVADVERLRSFIEYLEIPHGSGGES